MGDLVVIKRTQFGSGQKLVPQFMGPYRVTQVNRSDRYKVEKAAESEGLNETRTSADFMKPWIEDEDTDDELETNTEQNGRM